MGLTVKDSIPKHILPVIVLAQLAGTSLWFASNAILADLISAWGFPDSALATLTSSVQMGFIVGTLVFAFFAITDKISPRIVFTICALSGAALNAIILFLEPSFYGYCAIRFGVGACLAGVYPVGMKIAADWYSKDLGKALGFLVGALVLGTALPHFLRSFEQVFEWRTVITFVSCLAATGGVVLGLTVPDGPNRKAAPPFDPAAITRMFSEPKFRAATSGYFGHMWELYSFWAFVPVFLQAYSTEHPGYSMNHSLWSGLIIGMGSVGCVAGGLWSRRVGSAKVAKTQLAISGLFCLTFALLFQAPPWLFLAGLIIWGVTVVGDSPQFSALTARTAPAEYVGSALTIANCIGFSVTIVSLQVCSYVQNSVSVPYLPMFLAIGPAFGLWALRSNR